MIKKIKTNKIYISKRDMRTWLFLIMLSIPHLNPPYFELFPVVEMVMNFLRLISFLIILFWVLSVKRHISIIVILISIWEGFLFYTTVIHQGEVYGMAVSAFSVLSIVLLYDVAMEKKELLISSQLFCLELVIYVNFVTILLFPDGLYSEGSYLFTHYKNWFLGYYNNQTKYFIPAIMFALLYKKITGKIKRVCLLISIIIASSVLMWSGGVLVSVFALLFVYIFLKNWSFLFNYYTYWSTHIIFLVVVFVLKFQDIFNWLIDDVLGKMRSLESRIYIWGQTLIRVYDSPMIGYGIQSSFKRASEVHFNHGVHAHNLIFEILYQGGIIGLSMWIIIVIISGIKLYKYRDEDESKIISVAFLGWCIATLVEPFTSSFLMGMFVFAYHYKDKSIENIRYLNKTSNRINRRKL